MSTFSSVCKSGGSGVGELGASQCFGNCPHWKRKKNINKQAASVERSKRVCLFLNVRLLKQIAYTLVGKCNFKECSFKSW